MMDSLMQNNKWACLLAYVTGLVNQKLLLQNEYLAAENPYDQNTHAARRESLRELGRGRGHQRQRLGALRISIDQPGHRRRRTDMRC